VILEENEMDEMDESEEQDDLDDDDFEGDDLGDDDLGDDDLGDDDLEIELDDDYLDDREEPEALELLLRGRIPAVLPWGFSVLGPGERTRPPKFEWMGGDVYDLRADEEDDVAMPAAPAPARRRSVTTAPLVAVATPAPSPSAPAVAAPVTQAPAATPAALPAAPPPATVVALAPSAAPGPQTTPAHPFVFSSIAAMEVHAGVRVARANLRARARDGGGLVIEVFAELALSATEPAAGSHRPLALTLVAENASGWFLGYLSTPLPTRAELPPLCVRSLELSVPETPALVRLYPEVR
jgi:hypothetical protein